MRKRERPQISQGDGNTHDNVETHPAYGQIRASRVSGGAFLYGSDFQHQHFVTVSITRSKLHRSLHDDRPHGELRPIVEVAMSEAQWAQFVSSMNVGLGVQCTLEYIEGKGAIPGIAHIKDRKQQFADEIKTKLQSTVSELKELIAAIEGTKLSQKMKDELTKHAEKVLRDIGPNLDFTAAQFDEHMTRTISLAKTEIEAHASSVVSRMGLKALAEAQTQPIELLIGSGDEKD